MRALVTGGAGFIGSAIATRLLDSGWEVAVFDNLCTGLEENLPEGAEFIRGDLRDLDQLAAACAGVTIVFHQAALAGVPQSFVDPVSYDECNSQGTVNILLAAELAGVDKVVNASSCSVYGERSGVNKEDLCPHPKSPYGTSKLAAEHYCRIWTEAGRLRTISLRYFNVFGPRQRIDSQYAAVFPAFATALLAGKSAEIFGDGEQSRDFIYIDDVVSANICASEAGEEADGCALNVATGRARTVNEVFRAVADGLGVEPVAKQLAPRHGDARRAEADITSARKLLNWDPTAPWKESVAATVNWFRRTTSIGRGQSPPD